MRTNPRSRRRATCHMTENECGPLRRSELRPGRRASTAGRSGAVIVSWTGYRRRGTSTDVSSRRTMEIIRREGADGLELAVAGRLDAYWADHLTAALEEAINAGAGRI